MGRPVHYEVRSLASVRGCVDDPPLVFFHTEDIKPALEVGSGLFMCIVHKMRLHPKESSAHLGNEFFLGIHFPSEPVVLDEALAVQSVRMTSRVGLMPNSA